MWFCACFVNVVEGTAVGCKCEPAQITSWKRIRKNFAVQNIQQLKRPCTFATLLDLIKHQTAIGRNAKWLDRGVWPRSSERRINENFIRTINALAHANTELFLPNDALSSWNGIEIRPRVPCLCCDPLAGTRGLLVFQPAVGISHRHSVQDFSHR